MVAAFPLVILIGCGTTKDRVTAATVARAVAETPTRLPEAPTYCTDEMPTVIPGDEKWRWVQKRWEYTRDAEIKRDVWCWNVWYKGVVDHAAGVTQ